MKIWDDAKDLLTAPVVAEIDTVQLWALVGIVVVSLMIWVFILRHIRLAASEL